jgi:hypothetical protein
MEYRVVERRKVCIDKTYINYIVQRKIFYWWFKVDFFYDEKTAIDYCKRMMYTPIVSEKVIYSTTNKNKKYDFKEILNNLINKT